VGLIFAASFLHARSCSGRPAPLMPRKNPAALRQIQMARSGLASPRRPNDRSRIRLSKRHRGGRAHSVCPLESCPRNARPLVPQTQPEAKLPTPPTRAQEAPLPAFRQRQAVLPRPVSTRPHFSGRPWLRRGEGRHFLSQSVSSPPPIVTAIRKTVKIRTFASPFVVPIHGPGKTPSSIADPADPIGPFSRQRSPFYPACQPVMFGMRR